MGSEVLAHVKVSSKAVRSGKRRVHNVILGHISPQEAGAMEPGGGRGEAPDTGEWEQTR